MTDKKKFGLVMPKKAGTLKIKMNSVFDDSDEEEKSNKRPKIPQKKLGTKNKITESQEDPSIYEYDSIYDEMKAKQIESIAPKDKKNSRYIETLLKAADKRKKDYERRVDKKIQAEREKEGDQFKDKEAFVTSTYKKKLQEKEEEEERERRENMLNDMMDVSKQKDLSGFYRHFLNQTVGEESVPVFGQKQIKQEIDSDHDNIPDRPNENVREDKNIDQDSDGIEIDSESENESSDDKRDTEKKNDKALRKRPSRYEKRNKHAEETSESDDSKTVSSPKIIKTHNKKSHESSELDAEVGENHDKRTTQRNLHSTKYKIVDKNNETKKHNSRHDSSSSDESEHIDKSIDSDVRPVDSKSEKESKENIYVKRTVGDAFAEAQARYFQRMAARNSGI